MNRYTEDQRLQSLCALGILDTPQEERFDRFTALAAAAFSVPMALVSIVDAERQWFKSKHGIDADETAREVAFCSHAIEGDGPFIVEDARLDPRFADNPFVTGEPHVRFYAGQPVRTLDGHAIGTLCIVDTKPRAMDAPAIAMLVSLAKMVEDEINLPVVVAARQRAELALIELNRDLERKVAERTAALQEKNEALTREIRQRCQVEIVLRQREERIRSMIDTSFSAFVGTDAQGHIIEWNLAAERIFGWTRAELLGKPLASTLFPERYRDGHRADMARCQSSGPGAALGNTNSMHALNKSGEEIAVEISIHTLQVDGVGYFGAFMQDLSEKQRAREALEQKQELLDAVLETVDMAVIVGSADGGLSIFNRSAREFHGQSPADGGSQDWATQYHLYHPDGRTPLAPYEIPLVRALAGETVKDAKIVVAPPGMKRRTVLCSGRRLLSSSGERLGAVVAMKDITDLNEWQERLRENELRLRAIAENLPTLIGQVDADGRFVFLNSRALRFYGKPADRLLGQHVRMAYSADEYAKIAMHIEEAMGGRKVAFEGAMEVNGRQTYYHASYVPNLDETGRPNGFFAMAFDITARRTSELRQKESEERLRTITDNLPVLISYLDCDFRFRFANAMFADWLGVPSAGMLGRTVEEVFGGEFFEARRAALMRCRDGETAHVELPVERDGRARILSTTYLPQVRDGKVAGIYALSTDVTAAREHEKQLLSLAHSDPLTGLPNRRRYDETLDAAIARARRHGTAMALVYLDIDRFKHINDTLGHAAGDEVLVQFGARVRSALRSTDVLARLAGDEFTIILEAVSGMAQCERVADKILDSLATPLDVQGTRLKVSASIGVAYCAHQPVRPTLAANADDALYRSKHAGRGCRTVALVSGGAASLDPCPDGLQREAAE